MANILTKLLTLGEGRQLRKYEGKVEEINALEPQMQALSDAQLAGKTGEFRSRLDDGETTDDILAEAFAACREAAKRSIGLRHFDVQLVGGMVLNDGMIAEMKTGEGKTLVATLAAYLNALPGDGVHVVTVNDYLAKRDSEWMGRVYSALGLTTGHHPSPDAAVRPHPGVCSRTSPTARTRSSASTICATTWWWRHTIACSADTPTPSSTRSTRSSSTRHVPRSSSRAPAPSRPTCTSTSRRSSLA